MNARTRCSCEMHGDASPQKGAAMTTTTDLHSDCVDCCKVADEYARGRGRRDTFWLAIYFDCHLSTEERLRADSG